MTGTDNPMPLEEWLNSAIAFAKDDAEQWQLTITYPFDLAEVERVYTLAYYDGGGGDGLWFRLKNGVVYDIMGNRISHRKGCFERPVKGFEAIRTAAYVMERLQGHQPRRYGTQANMS